MKLELPHTSVKLERHPPDTTLRAWDAADEYALATLAELPETGRTLVVNDAFGALAVVLATSPGATIDTWSDSFVSQLATRANLERNARPSDSVRTITAPDELHGPYDTMVVKIPRHLSLLEHQLRAVAPHLHAATRVIGAAMTKHIHSSTIERFERLLGPTTTTLAKKKARLIVTTVDAVVADAGGAAGTETEWSAFRLDSGETIHSAPGVFSGARLDAGSSLLIEALRRKASTLSPVEHLIDLGCGNGVVGLVAASLWPEAAVTFVDESFLAVRSAQRTWQANGGDATTGRFVAGDGLGEWADGEGIESASIDLVVNNPPFHDNNAETDATAWRMFADAHRALRPGGELWVVGNRHLAYHAKLKRRFGNCAVVSSNSRFVVLRATRT